jgi:exopolyphosphatase/guanosine-5'-triphosphate,3'-diphosphate pyrophosphatase
MLESKKIAAIDIGTNSFHMIIASIDSKGLLNIIQREKELVRLGNSPSDMKQITSEAMERGVNTLKNFSKIAESENAIVKAIATSAVREAENQKDFIENVYRETGVEVEVISGREEARLIYSGAIRSLPVFEKKTLLIDIGGGSTETLIGLNGQDEYCNSTKIGTVRLTKKFFDKEKVTKNDIDDCIDYVKGEWTPILDKLKRRDFEYVIATSGTLQNLIAMAAVKSGVVLLENSNGLKASSDMILKVIDRIKVAKNPDKIRKIKGLDAQRADIILAGALIVEIFIKHLNIKEIVFSSYALREGIFFKYYQLLNSLDVSTSISKIRKNTTLMLVKKYGLDINHSKYISKLSLKLFSQLQILHNLTEVEKELLQVASYLHDCGFYISHDKHHKHSYYLILNTEMPGFTIHESELIANIARYHRKSLPKQSHSNFNNLNENDKRKIWVLGGILRIVEGIDRRQLGIVENIEIIIKNDTIEIELKEYEGHNIDIEIWGANRRKDMLEIALDRKIIIRKTK